MKRTLIGLMLVAAPAWAAYDANGIQLGVSEKRIGQVFPSAHCKPLQWASNAADRRCDDSKILFGGVSSRITFYLKEDKVQAFDVRFESRDAERLAAYLRQRYGPPLSERREKVEKKRGGELYRVEWERDGERAVLTSQSEKRRASLTVSHGDFEEEIYRVR